jgi:predicted alpha/beta superfamily hydrolase
MEQYYRADTDRSRRVILGHSYGGLLGAYSFSVNNNLFGNYLILSPSLWFDNSVSFQFEKDNRAKNKSMQQLVFMGIGNNETEDRMKVPFEKFYQLLRDNYPNTKLAKNVEPNTSHMDSKKPNITKGLEYYFENR